MDNRTELRARLLRHGASGSALTRTPSSYCAHISVRGEECPRFIIGDFAFAIWDGRRRQLFCARDFLGVKPFYYYTDGRRFLCGSELRQLFADASMPQRPNEAMIGEYLAVEISDLEETLYVGILRLPPAHWLIVTPGRLRKGRYWDFEPERTIRYRSDREYAEHFRTVFEEAVRCRLRSTGPIGAQLSGGVDPHPSSRRHAPSTAQVG